jgi:hypothetical protein
MSKPILVTALLTTLLPALPAWGRPDEHGKGHRDDQRREEHEDRGYWRDRDKEEKRYWKEQEGRGHQPHRYDRDERDHGRGHRPPPWMNSYWRTGESRRYVALVPGDPSRMYVFLDGRWILRRVTDPRARLDLEGAFQLPAAPPPIAPPHLGIDLHVVLFN